MSHVFPEYFLLLVTFKLPDKHKNAPLFFLSKRICASSGLVAHSAFLLLQGTNLWSDTVETPLCLPTPTQFLPLSEAIKQAAELTKQEKDSMSCGVLARIYKTCDKNLIPLSCQNRRLSRHSTQGLPQSCQHTQTHIIQR